MNIKETQEFEVFYREDGVYVKVCENVASDVSVIASDILSRLDKKMVFDVDAEQVEYATHKKGENIKIAPKQSEIEIKNKAILDISKDKMEANLKLTPNEGSTFITTSELIDELNARGVVHGIDENQINSMVSAKLTDIYLLVAKGKPPVNGTDAKILYHFCTEKEITPTTRSDGTIDHKRLNIVKNVLKGELLLEISPATEGIVGTNVMGVSISAKNGKDAKIKTGANIIESEDKLKYYSAIDGRVIVEKSGKITVSEILEIEHNVDNATGNISFKGTVIVKNSVRTGFSIVAGGDIHVKGVIEGATISAKGNITVDRGIQGNNQAKIECEGNLHTKFIENAEVICHGDVEVDFILHSFVTAKRKIIVNGKKATIAGGKLRAGEFIRAAIIGSNMGTTTDLEVGIDPEIRTKHIELANEIKNIQKKCNELMKTIELLNKALKEGHLPTTKKELLINSLNAYKALMANQTALKARRKIIDNMINNLSRGKVHASNVIYPGVKITIIDAIMHINDELPCSTLFKKNGEVTIGAYEK